MTETSPRLVLPYIAAAQAQKHITHNEAIRTLDQVVQLVLVAVDAVSPPASAAVGEVYALAETPDGEWAGQGGQLATRDASGWTFVSPQIGWMASLRDAGTVVMFGTNGWAAPTPDLRQLDGVGIGTDWDAINRLSVNSEATLLNHAGAGHQLKLNKASGTDTASLLFQSNWTGHAEMGLAGETAFSVKVSADGTTWLDALRADPGTQETTLSATGVGGMRLDSMETPWLRQNNGGVPSDWWQMFHQGNVLGAVSQTGGTPTGAVIERGANANGDYVRWADGTQICTHRIDLGTGSSTSNSGGMNRSDTFTVDFPATFVSVPACSISNPLYSFGFSYSISSSETQWLARIARPTAWTNNPYKTVSLLALGRWF